MNSTLRDTLNITLKSDTLNKDLLPFSMGTDDYTRDLPRDIEDSKEPLINVVLDTSRVMAGAEAISERFQNRSI
jgi:hypothetical protein